MARLTRRECLKVTGAGLAAFASMPGHARAAHHKTKPLQPGMVYVPAGTFLMGTTAPEAQQLALAYGYDPSWFSGEVPQLSIHLPDFAIDRYPVTNREYALFCSATGHPEPKYWRQPGGGPPPDMLMHPVTGVNKLDAKTYASWIGKRLPTEEEWEKAARGTDGRVFPWGNQWNPLACRWNRSGASKGPWTSSVGTHPTGVSPYGAMDMAGNVAEWCEASLGNSEVSVIKGGSGINGEITNLRAAARNMSSFNTNTNLFYGFRCARDVT